MAGEVEVMMPEVIGTRIAKLMNDNGISRKELAALCEVTEMTVSLWVRGERIPSDPMKLKISQMLHRSVKFIFYTP